MVDLKELDSDGLDKEIKRLEKEQEAVDGSKLRGKFVVRFHDRTRVEGTAYSNGDVAGFDKELYDKIVARGVAVDYENHLDQQLRTANKFKARAEKSPSMNKPKTRDVQSPR